MQRLLERRGMQYAEDDESISYQEDDMPFRCYFDAEGRLTKVESIEDGS